MDDDDDENDEGGTPREPAAHVHEHHRGDARHPNYDIAAVAREAAREAVLLEQQARAIDAKGKPFGGLKGIVAMAVALGGLAGGFITIGERVSTVSQRSERAETGVAELRGGEGALAQRLTTVEYDTKAAATERASIVSRLQANSDASIRQIEDLRKNREENNVRLGRIEQRLDDIRTALDRRGGKLSLPMPWQDAGTSRPLTPP